MILFQKFMNWIVKKVKKELCNACISQLNLILKAIYLKFITIHISV
jgi:hypothetical protein